AKRSPPGPTAAIRLLSLSETPSRFTSLHPLLLSLSSVRPPRTERASKGIVGGGGGGAKMYHPSRGGVRGGRDQFKWDDVKVDKHRENYLGHSIMAPVGRWQKGKDLHWYTRDQKSKGSDADALKDEIRMIKEQEEQAMREALGLAPKRATRPQGNRLDKHEYAELVKRGSTAEDMGSGHAEAAQVQGLGLYKGHHTWAESVSSPNNIGEAPSDTEENEAPPRMPDSEVAPEKVPSEEDRESRRKRRREERRHDKEKKREKHSHESGSRRRHGSEDGKRRHSSKVHM
ncbi:hypothetical protein Taro_005375, partial [Colocasia esculenta]|nr:hypothetical protein [Colocasia esculenta]